MRHRSDSSKAEIVDALRKAGVHVEIIERPVDLLCYRDFRWFLLEAKPQGWTKHSKRQTDQAAFIRRFHIPIVRTAEEALIAAGVMRA